MIIVTNSTGAELREQAIYVLAQMEKDKNVTVDLAIRNRTPRTIRCANVYLEPFDASGRKVACRMTGEGRKSIMVSGPIRPETDGESEGAEIRYPELWHNSLIDQVRAYRIEVTFDDGTTEEWTDDNMVFEVKRKKKGLIFWKS